ncbi:MAG TPA: flavodoxin domain-containing protein [Gemmatimonadaceae bacterium]
MSRHILVMFGTSYGQTEKIAVRIAAGLARRGLLPELCNAAKDRPSLPLREYAGIVVGSSIIARGHQPAIKEFVRTNVALLNEMPSAFFQVSASAGSASPDARMAAQQIMCDFMADNAWTPVLSASLPGAINYTQYSLLLKWYMKRASAKNGGSTDTSRDHEYTDWAEVDRFADALAAEFVRVEEFAEMAIEA